MNISELLRGLADALSNIEQENNTSPEADSGVQNTTDHIDSVKDQIQDNADKAEQAKDDLGVFLPPLQAKLELLKRAVDVDNIYDEKDAERGDDLVQIKRLSGINPVAISELGDDEPLEG
jgi:ABC-type transporter Mla subunit MlaD